MKKRLLSILFCIVMIIGLMPAYTFADELDEEPVATTEMEAEEDFAEMSVEDMPAPASAVEYKIWVNGEEFTSDKLTINCGGGTAVYDPATGNITLNSAVITQVKSGYGIYSNENLKMTITLNGNNSITLSDDGGIGVDGDIEFDGTGNLSINAGGSTHDGISTMGNVTIKNIEMTILAPEGIGIASDKKVHLNNAKLKSSGLYAGVDAYELYIENNCDVELASTAENCNAAFIKSGNITINDSKVTATSYYPGLFAGGNLKIHNGDIQSTSTADAAIWARGDLRIESGSKVILDGQRPSGCGGDFTVGAVEIDAKNTNVENIPAIDPAPVIDSVYKLSYAMAVDSEGTEINLLQQADGHNHLNLYKNVHFITDERVETYKIPFTKTVKQAGDIAPGEETFKFEIFDIGNGNENSYKDVTYTADIKTNGKGAYDGELVISGPVSQVREFVCEGFFVREVKSTTENWTYSDVVWSVMPDVSTDTSESKLQIYATKAEQSDNGVYYSVDHEHPVERMTFENVFTLNKPEDPLVTYEIPFTKTVKQDGNVAPGEEIFKFEIFDIGNGNENNYKDVTYTASVKTNGKGTYDGKLVISGPSSQVREFVCEGFFVREVKGTTQNWTYSDAVWSVMPVGALDAEKNGFQIYATKKEQSGDSVRYMIDQEQPVAQMTFENVYTLNKPEEVDDPVINYEIPFTKTVKQDGNIAPGEETFKFEIFNIGNSNEIKYKDVTYTAQIKTNGKGSYDGKMVISGPASQVYELICEGFFVREVKGNTKNWTYSDAVWGIMPKTDLNTNTISLQIYATKTEKTKDGIRYTIDQKNIVNKMTFENTYTLNGNLTSGSPKTGDEMNPVLWISILCVSGCTVIAAAILLIRKKKTK